MQACFQACRCRRGKRARRLGFEDCNRKFASVRCRGVAHSLTPGPRTPSPRAPRGGITRHGLVHIDLPPLLDFRTNFSLSLSLSIPRNPQHANPERAPYGDVGCWRRTFAGALGRLHRAQLPGRCVRPHRNTHTHTHTHTQTFTHSYARAHRQTDRHTHRQKHNVPTNVCRMKTAPVQLTRSRWWTRYPPSNASSSSISHHTRYTHTRQATIFTIQCEQQSYLSISHSSTTHIECDSPGVCHLR